MVKTFAVYAIILFGRMVKMSSLIHSPISKAQGFKFYDDYKFFDFDTGSSWLTGQVRSIFDYRIFY